jgi:hypothetical protein
VLIYAEDLNHIALVQHDRISGSVKAALDREPKRYCKAVSSKAVGWQVGEYVEKQKW